MITSTASKGSGGPILPFDPLRKIRAKLQPYPYQLVFPLVYDLLPQKAGSPGLGQAVIGAAYQRAVRVEKASSMGRVQEEAVTLGVGPQKDVHRSPPNLHLAVSFQDVFQSKVLTCESF